MAVGFCLLVLFIIAKSMGASSDCGAGVCSAKCDATGSCVCPAGFHLSDDHKTCTDSNECELWPPVCPQRCVNHPGSYECTCAPGYHVTEDRRHCESDLGAIVPQVVYSEDRELLMLPMHNLNNDSYYHHGQPTLLHTASGPITAIAVNAADRQIYFFDTANSQIDCLTLLQDSSVEYKKGLVANGLENVAGLAWDWIGRNLYILESKQHSVVACAIDTDQCLTLVSGLEGKPRSIAVDSNQGLLFWSECIHPFNRIMTSSMDGGEMRMLVDTSGRCASSLLVDQTTNSLYWTDEEVHFIKRVDLDGFHKKSLESPYLVRPTGLAMFEDWMVWSSRGVEGELAFIALLPKTMQPHALPTPLVSALAHTSLNLAVLHPTLQSSNEEMDTCSRLSCSALCLPTGQRMSARCECPGGQILQIENNKCLPDWSVESLLVVRQNRVLRVLPSNVGERVHDVTVVANHHVTAIVADVTHRDIILAELKDGDASNGSVIVRINLLDLNNVTVLITDAGYVSSLSYDWLSRNFYWVDTNKKTIEMSRISGIGGSHIFPDRGLISQPNSVAVDPVDGRVYFSNCGTNKFIGSCDLGGGACERLELGVNVSCVSSLIVDPRLRVLYWTDPDHSVIARHILGSKQTHPLRNSPHPLHLSLSSSFLFWTDAHDDDLLAHRRFDSEHGSRVRLQLVGIEALTSMDAYVQPQGRNGCSEGNGGCSDICIAESQMRRRCIYLPGAHLLPDQQTCFTNKKQADVTKTLDFLQKMYRPGPQLECPPNFCPSGIACLAISHRNFKCLCPNGWTGLRCELRTGASLHWAVSLFISCLCISIIVMCVACGYKAYGKLKNGNALTLKEVRRVMLASGQRVDNLEDSKALIKKERQESHFVDVVVMPTDQNLNMKENNLR